VLTDEDKQWIRQQLEGLETRLLAEFARPRLPSPEELRARTRAAVERVMDLEMEFGQGELPFRRRAPPPQPNV